ncbi:hypothetical protein AK812_SmicGene43181 [Symbiodinium microadriaticum]|uniref:Uncharacterized protein n=1 Tax=Symbiodinium microadriaticum TaxID=2951 RepID=A0A1Q9C1P5_SYMMI|nr:hypothetical protein AK812_SmicGene43181 [Symbiodinium microadriaticum]
MYDDPLLCAVSASCSIASKAETRMTRRQLAVPAVSPVHGEVPAVSQHLMAEDSDEDIAAVNRILQCVRRCEKPAHRGAVSAKIARCGRQRISAARQRLKVTERIASLVNRHNAVFAKTQEDVIDLNAKKEEKIKGKGNYKRWLPTALLQACWGSRPRRRKCAKPKLTRLTKKTRCQVKVAAPTVSSVRACARQWHSSTTHITNVRACMSELYMRIQEDGLSNLTRAAEQWVHIALDETTEPVTVNARAELSSVLVIHMKIVRLSASGRQLERLNVVLPTALLNTTSTADLHTALMGRLPLTLKQLEALAEKTIFLLNTDSFSSCMRLRKLLSTQVRCLSCPCRMHQLSLSLTSGLMYSGLMSALFCGSLTLRQSRFQRLLRARLRAILEDPEKLVICYESPDHSAVSHAQAVWDLFWPLVTTNEKEQAGERRVGGKKAKAWRRLRRNLKGPLNSNTVTHFCPLGCHTSRKAVVDDLYDDLCTLFLDSPPPTPAFNKWTKISPVCEWFCPLFRVHNLLPQMLEPVLSSLQAAASSKLTQSLLPEADDDITLGLGQSEEFAQQEYLRVRRFHAFVTTPHVGDKLMAVLLAMKPSLRILGVFFTSATETGHMLQDAEPTCTALELGRPSKSPAVKAVAVLLDALADERHELWQALLPSTEEWNERLYCLAATAACLQVGQLQSRLVLPFAAWPWKAALFFEDDSAVSQERKNALAQELLDLCVHQEDFVVQYKQGLNCVADVLGELNLERTHHLLQTAPITNFISEKSFAGSHTRRATNQGMQPKHPTLAAQHVLAESKTILDTSQFGKAAHHSVQAPSRAPQDAKGSSAWHNFVRQHNCSNKTLADVAQLWRARDQDATRTANVRLPARTASHVRLPASRGTRAPADADTAEVPQAAGPWPFAGDGFYPIRAEHLEALCPAVARLAQDWNERVGQKPCDPKPTPKVTEGPVCSSTCVHALPEGQRALREDLRKRLNRWASMCKTRAQPTASTWQPLPLYYIAAANASLRRRPEVSGFVLLQLCPVQDQQVYCRCDVAAQPEQGTRLPLPVTAGNLVSAAEVLDESQKMRGLYGDLQCWHINYKHVALTLLEVLEVQDAAAKEKEHAAKRQADKRASTIKAAVRSLDDQSLSRPTKRMRRKTALNEPGPDAGAHVADNEGEALRAWDAEIEAEAVVPDASSKEEGLAQELLGEFDAEASDVEDVLDLAAAVAVDEAESSASPAGAAASSSSAGCGSRQPRPPAPSQSDVCDLRNLRMDEDGKVFNGAGGYLGRLTSLKVGTPQEAFSVYCARHGCQFIRKVDRDPSKIALLSWFQRGLEIPVGKDLSFQTAHKKTFPGPGA